MNLVVGFGVADIEPVAFVEHDGAEFLLMDEFDKCGDDGDNFFVWYQWEDVGFDAVDARELVGARFAAEEVAHVRDLITVDIDVAVRSMRTERECGDVSRCLVMGNELSDIDIG